jgi:hypothetical protein
MPDGTGPAGGPRYSVPGYRPAAPSARRRRRTRSVSGPVGVLSVGTCPGLTARSCSSGLDTVVPAADPPTPLGIGLAAVLPEHFSGSSPGSRPLGFRAVTLPPRRRFHPVPVPIAVFGVTGILNRRLGTVNRSERNPHESMVFPQWKGLVCTEQSTDLTFGARRSEVVRATW